jgi:hypothetical protein
MLPYAIGLSVIGHDVPTYLSAGAAHAEKSKLA